jgi:protein-L-isoaspartate(D-aspartate) O-methyltransferase
MLEMMDRQGKVVGVEHIEPLTEQSIKNLQKSYSNQLKDESIVIVYGDGRQGFQKHAPYNAIHVGAGISLSLTL